MIQAVVFDFDGLILDTETPWFEAFHEVYRQEYGVQMPLDVWSQFVGTHGGYDMYDWLDDQIGKSADRESIRVKAHARHAELMKTVALRPGVVEYLHTAKELGLKIGLASSSDRAWVERHLQERGLYEQFEVIRTRDDVEKPKPDPELYVAALSALGVDPQHGLAFEDSLNGLVAAKAAGMSCVIFPNPTTERLPFENYDLRFDSMAEIGLGELLEQLGQKVVK